MNLDNYYIETGDRTTFWFATGFTPTLGLITQRTLRVHVDQIADNIKANNSLLKHLRWNSVCPVAHVD